MTPDRPTLWERMKGQCRVAWSRLSPTAPTVKDEPMKRRPHIECLVGKSGKWHWRIVGSNGRIVNPTETYTRKAGCLRMASRYGDAFGCEVRVIEGGETRVLVKAK